MNKRGFSSIFAADLNNMIDFKVATGGAESTYIGRARNFDTFCNMRHVANAQLTEALELEWLQPVMQKEPQIIHERICFINGFASYLNNIGKTAHVLNNRFANGRTVFVPYLFTDEEMARLFHVIDTDESTRNKFQRILFSVYFRMVYTCGLRPMEGRKLKQSDINLNSGEVRIECSKERKSRMIIMSDDMRMLAAKYSNLLKIAYPETELFFPSVRGSVCQASYFQNHFVSFFQKANPSVSPEFLPRVRVYDLRHRFATAAIHRWLEEGVSLSARLPYLQMYMGHKNIMSTMYYVHLLPEHLVKNSDIDWESLSHVFPGRELWEE